jgi:hypothetical protein
MEDGGAGVGEQGIAAWHRPHTHQIEEPRLGAGTVGRRPSSVCVYGGADMARRVTSHARADSVLF